MTSAWITPPRKRPRHQRENRHDTPKNPRKTTTVTMTRTIKRIEKHFREGNVKQVVVRPGKRFEWIRSSQVTRMTCLFKDKSDWVKNNNNALSLFVLDIKKKQPQLNKQTQGFVLISYWHYVIVIFIRPSVRNTHTKCCIWSLTRHEFSIFDVNMIILYPTSAKYSFLRHIIGISNFSFLLYVLKLS